MQIRDVILDVFASQFDGNVGEINKMLRVDDGSEFFQKKKITEEDGECEFIDLDSIKKDKTCALTSQEKTMEISAEEKRHIRKQHRREKREEKNEENVEDSIRNTKESFSKETKPLAFSTAIGRAGSLQDFITSRRLTTNATGIFANSKLSRPAKRRKHLTVGLHQKQESEAMKSAIEESFQRIVHGASSSDATKDNNENEVKENRCLSGWTNEFKKSNSCCLSSRNNSTEARLTPLKTPCTSLPFETPLAEISDYLRNSFNPKELFNGKDYLKELRDSLRKVYRQSLTLFENTEDSKTLQTTPRTEGTIRLNSRKSIFERSLEYGKLSSSMPLQNDAGNLFETLLNPSSSEHFEDKRHTYQKSTTTEEKAGPTDSICDMKLSTDYLNKKVIVEQTNQNLSTCVPDPYQGNKFYKDPPASQDFSFAQPTSDLHYRSFKERYAKRRKTATSDIFVKAGPKDLHFSTFPCPIQVSVDNNDTAIRTNNDSVRWSDISNSTATSTLNLEGDSVSSQDFLDYIDKVQSETCIVEPTARDDTGNNSLFSDNRPPVNSPTPPREMYRMKMF